MSKGRPGLSPLMAVLALLLFSVHLFGQADHRISGGVLAGIPLTDSFHSARSPGDFQACFSGFSFCDVFGYFSKTKRYIVGAGVEWHFYRHLAIELDVLYRRLNYDYAMAFANSSLTASLYSTSTAANNWEFPLLLKYRFGTARFKPFLESGMTANWVNGINQGVTVSSRSFMCCFSSLSHSSNSSPPELDTSGTIGFVGGGGIEFRVHALKIAPEIRFMRWKKENFTSTVVLTSGPLLHSNLNQAQFLLSLRL